MGLLWRLQPEVDAHLIHRTIETPAAPTLPAFSHLDGMKPESGAAIDQRTTSPRRIVFDPGALSWRSAQREHGSSRDPAGWDTTDPSNPRTWQRKRPVLRNAITLVTPR
jgi:hypothetical protein